MLVRKLVTSRDGDVDTLSASGKLKSIFTGSILDITTVIRSQMILDCYPDKICYQFLIIKTE